MDKAWDFSCVASQLYDLRQLVAIFYFRVSCRARGNHRNVPTIKRRMREPWATPAHRSDAPLTCIVVQMTTHFSLKLVLVMMLRYALATTLETQLASTYSSCYDPAGSSCTCSETINLSSLGLAGTIPAELSACTDVTVLYVRSCRPSPQPAITTDHSCIFCSRYVGRAQAA